MGVTVRRSIKVFDTEMTTYSFEKHLTIWKIVKHIWGRVLFNKRAPDPLT